MNVMTGSKIKVMRNDGSMTEKMKKNSRKISSGVPNKMSGGRSGQNVVIPGIG